MQIGESCPELPGYASRKVPLRLGLPFAELTEGLFVKGEVQLRDTTRSAAWRQPLSMSTQGIPLHVLRCHELEPG